MKKSLLIAPALGVLVLAAAGSVGGTVAWFSSNTAWNIDASEFAITKLDGNLKATITANADHGSSKVSDKSVTITGNMTDASVNVTDPASIAVYSTHGTIAEGKHYADHSGNWVAEAATAKNGNKALYWAVSWDVLFSFDFPQNTTDVNLYFDTAESSALKKNGESWEGIGDDDAMKGLRIAFVGQAVAQGGTTADSAAYTRVWAPFRAASEATNVKYVADVDTEAAAAYAANTVIYSDTDNSSFKTSASNDRGATCLGYFHVASANATAKLKYTFVAWFEGTDPNVIDEKTLGSVKSSIAFFTRQATAA